jgi:hypothetical protein
MKEVGGPGPTGLEGTWFESGGALVIDGLNCCCASGGAGAMNCWGLAIAWCLCRPLMVAGAEASSAILSPPAVVGDALAGMRLR